MEFDKDEESDERWDGTPSQGDFVVLTEDDERREGVEDAEYENEFLRRAPPPLEEREAVEFHEDSLLGQEASLIHAQVSELLALIRAQRTHLSTSIGMLSSFPGNTLFDLSGLFEASSLSTKFRDEYQIPDEERIQLEEKLLMQESELEALKSSLIERCLWTDAIPPCSPCPPVKESHWDTLLNEMKFVSSEASDIRLWKIRAAKKLALSAASYVERRAREVKFAAERESEPTDSMKSIRNHLVHLCGEYWSSIRAICSLRRQLEIEELEAEYLVQKQSMMVLRSTVFSRQIAAEFSQHPSVTGIFPSTSGDLTADPNFLADSVPSPSDPSVPISEKGRAGGRKKSAPSFTKDRPDDERTIEEEEKKGTEDYAAEIALLEMESEMSIEELRRTYGVSSDAESQSSDVSEAVDIDYFFDSSSSSESDDDSSDTEDSTSKETKNGLTSTVSVDEISERRRHLEKVSATAAGTLQQSESLIRVPMLLNQAFTLRDYQHVGLDWLVKMHDRNLNVILADEMGLGKTIMTVALLAHLASTGVTWGPHLIVVPTSVMINWEIELKRWCPSLKILVYFGSPKERKKKREGWRTPDHFHVCITSYQLAVTDEVILRRTSWYYMILDEAHHIKNFRSKRWKVLLNFSSKRRLLLTGTPLQNSVMEIWSLMHFLMPDIFQSDQEFREWFDAPLMSIVEGNSEKRTDVVSCLHAVLRPFILRRLKSEVERSLPPKFEHIVRCSLSKRQRQLYEEFMSRYETRQTLQSGGFFGLLSVLMQLRKVCNHPDLFEPRTIHSPFCHEPLDLKVPGICVSAYQESIRFDAVRCATHSGLVIPPLSFQSLLSFWDSEIDDSPDVDICSPYQRKVLDIKDALASLDDRVDSGPTRSLYTLKLRNALDRYTLLSSVHRARTLRYRMFGSCLGHLASLLRTCYDADISSSHSISFLFEEMFDLSSIHDRISRFSCSILPALSEPPRLISSQISSAGVSLSSMELSDIESQRFCSLVKHAYHPFDIRSKVFFPDKKLIQYDAGKLQMLDVLLKDLKANHHRALIFTQMSKMLDILEEFLCLHGHTYVRLDGATGVEKRMQLVEQFNSNDRIFCFILSTRSGGIGLNLTGADSVIFFDSDWNPAMDAQAQDRAHRIGQTREVHIYRFVTEASIEESILRKAQQKRDLDNMVVQSAHFNTQFFRELELQSIVSSVSTLQPPQTRSTSIADDEYSSDHLSSANEDVESAIRHAEEEMDGDAMREIIREEEELEAEFAEDVEAIVVGDGSSVDVSSLSNMFDADRPGESHVESSSNSKVETVQETRLRDLRTRVSHIMSSINPVQRLSLAKFESEDWDSRYVEKVQRLRLELEQLRSNTKSLSEEQSSIPPLASSIPSDFFPPTSARSSKSYIDSKFLDYAQNECYKDSSTISASKDIPSPQEEYPHTDTPDNQQLFFRLPFASTSDMIVHIGRRHENCETGISNDSIVRPVFRFVSDFDSTMYARIPGERCEGEIVELPGFYVCNQEYGDTPGNTSADRLIQDIQCHFVQFVISVAGRSAVFFPWTQLRHKISSAFLVSSVNARFKNLPVEFTHSRLYDICKSLFPLASSKRWMMDGAYGTRFFVGNPAAVQQRMNELQGMQIYPYNYSQATSSSSFLADRRWDGRATKFESLLVYESENFEENFMAEIFPETDS